MSGCEKRTAESPPSNQMHAKGRRRAHSPASSGRTCRIRLSTSALPLPPSSIPPSSHLRPPRPRCRRSDPPPPRRAVSRPVPAPASRRPPLPPFPDAGRGCPSPRPSIGRLKTRARIKWSRSVPMTQTRRRNRQGGRHPRPQLRPSRPRRGPGGTPRSVWRPNCVVAPAAARAKEP